MSKVNGAMRERHELEKLKATAEKIHNNYNVVEAVSEEMEKVLCDGNFISLYCISTFSKRQVKRIYEIVS